MRPGGLGEKRSYSRDLRRAQQPGQRPFDVSTLLTGKPPPAGPARNLREAVYRLYAEADRQQLAELAQQIAGDHDVPESPGRDLIEKIISGDGCPASTTR
jgi:hypothetical protein